MKRKITELEENLIKKGWHLAFKTYFGKHNDKVQSYIYEKTYTREFERKDGKVEVANCVARVVLDSKRNHIDDVLVSSPNTSFINEYLAAVIFDKIRDVGKEVNNCYPKDTSEETMSAEEVDEVVEVAEAISESNE